MHENGVLKTEYGSIITKSGTMIDNLAMIIDLETGGVMKYGDQKDKYLEDYLLKLKKSQEMIGIDSEDIVLINFDRYDGALNIEQICSLANWFICCSGNATKEVLNWPAEKMLSKIETLQRIGY